MCYTGSTREVEKQFHGILNLFLSFVRDLFLIIPLLLLEKINKILTEIAFVSLQRKKSIL